MSLTPNVPVYSGGSGVIGITYVLQISEQILRGLIKREK